MTVSGPRTPEPQPAAPGVRTHPPAPSPLRSNSDHSPASSSLHLGPQWDSSATRSLLSSLLPGSALSPSPTPPPLPPTGQLSGAAAEGGQRAVQMRGLPGSPDGLHPGPGSGRDAPGPGHSAPEPGRLPPQAGEGAAPLPLACRPRFAHLAAPRAPAGHSPPQATHTCQKSFGLLGLGGGGVDQVTVENSPPLPLVLWKGDGQPLRPLCLLLQEDYDKAETEASKGRVLPALVGSCGASMVGKDPGATAPSQSPFLSPLKHICLLSFPLPRVSPFLQLLSPFLRLECWAPHSSPHLPLALEIFPSCSCLETEASWVLTELPFLLSH